MSDPFPTNSPTYLALTTDLRELLLLLTSPLPDLSSHLLPLPLHQQLTASLNPTTQSDLTQELSPVSSSAPSSNSSVSSSETDINAGTRTSGAAGSVIHDTNDGPSFGGIDEEDPDVHEHCGADDRKREKGPSIIAHTSSPVSTPTPASIPSSPPPAGSIPYPLLRQIGLFCTSPEGRDLLSAHSIDPSPYHPNSLLPLTHPLLPPTVRAPPASSNPLQPPSPFLPPTHHSNQNADAKLTAAQKSAGGGITGLGKELGAIANVLFSAGGVAGGVWWVGRRSTGWSLETTILLSLLAFFALILVESTLYVIYFKRMARKRELDADVKAKWEKGGLTVPDGKRIIAIERTGPEPASAEGIAKMDQRTVEAKVGIDRVDKEQQRFVKEEEGDEREHEGKLRRRIVGLGSSSSS